MNEQNSVVEPVASEPVEVVSNITTAATTNKRSNKLLLILIALILLLLALAAGVGSYIFFTQNNQSGSEVTPTPTPEVTVTSTIPTISSNPTGTNVPTTTTPADPYSRWKTHNFFDSVSFKYPPDWTAKQSEGNDGAGVTVTSPKGSIFVYSNGLGSEEHANECASGTTVRGNITFKRFLKTDDTWSEDYDVWYVCESINGTYYHNYADGFSYRVKSDSDLATLDLILKSVTRN